MSTSQPTPDSNVPHAPLASHAGTDQDACSPEFEIHSLKDELSVAEEGRFSAEEGWTAANEQVQLARGQHRAALEEIRLLQQPSITKRVGLILLVLLAVGQLYFTYSTVRDWKTLRDREQLVAGANQQTSNPSSQQPQASGSTTPTPAPQPSDAVSHLETGRKLAAEAKGLADRGKMADAKSKFLEAIAEFDNAITANDKLAAAYLAKGDAYAAAGEKAKSDKAYVEGRKALKKK